MDKDCIFCKIVRRKIETDIVLESESFVAFYDIKPRVKGHLLVVPKQHWVTLLDIPNKYGDELIEFTKKAASFLLEKKYGDAFNIVMNNLEPAGQIVMHAHLHLIPRKDDDGLRMIA